MNMKLKLLDFSLCRTPAFSTGDELKEKWEELKKMIREASPSFYPIIKDLSPGELSRSDTKISFSIWKYFNRARYRATPYGHFAAFSLLPVLAEEIGPPVLNSEMLSNDFIDWKEKEGHTNNSVIHLKKADWFQINSTVYTLGKEHRYVRVKGGTFEIAAVTGFPELDALLKLCREKASKDTIYYKMTAIFQLPRKAIDNLLVQMLSLQLLLTDRCPNITGEDFFKRINIRNLNPGAAYVISERKIIFGGLDSRKLGDIPELISFLAKYLPVGTNAALNDFRLAFLKKFEQHAIPLTVAMDLETGIGYDNLGEQQMDHRLPDLLNISGQEKRKVLHIPYTELHRFLLNKLTDGGVIRLEEFESHQTAATLPLPNTLSILFHYWKGQPVIHNAGGCTANALLGRFTIASKALEEFGRGIASLEEKANPDILFFDIAYQGEKDVDNVNRRKQLYPYELPILSWSCDPSPLHLDDILVAVRGMEIILWSKKHQRRMVPRMPSAYNYTRSDLAIFRFLCDLQHHQIKSDLNFKMQYFFPGLHVYPRVTFKNVIVSPATWLLPQEVSNAAKSGNLKSAKIMLSNWLYKKGIDFRFKAGHADQTLCFDPCTDADMDAFLLYCSQNVRKEIYISEALIADEDGLKDSSGKTYTTEFQANYHHEHQIYQPFELINVDVNSKRYADPIIFPGGEWLYFEIYCHPSRTDRILLDQISKLLKETKIQKWFFIRYDDPKPHIRLRLHIKDMADGYPTVSRLKSLLEHDCQTGLISDIQIKTYFRETERYGALGMEQIEQFFFIDSKYILRLLARTASITDFYAASLIMMQTLLALALPDINDQVSFCKNVADQFSKDMGMDQAGFKRLNRRFQELKTCINLDHNSIKFRSPHQLKRAFVSICNSCSTVDSVKKILADILHMHVNRLFNADQRAHEAILYHYLIKILMTRRALSTVQSGCTNAI